MKKKIEWDQDPCISPLAHTKGLSEVQAPDGKTYKAMPGSVCEYCVFDGNGMD